MSGYTMPAWGSYLARGVAAADGGGDAGVRMMTLDEERSATERKYREATRTDPDDAGAHYELGLLLLNTHGDIDGAEVSFRAARRADPRHVGACKELGSLLFMARDDLDGAGDAFRAGLLVDPGNAKLSKVGELLPSASLRATPRPFSELRLILLSGLSLLLR